MTALSDAQAAPAPSTAVPVRAQGLELLGPLTGSGYERQPWLVRRGDGQTLQMTPLLYAVLEAIDGRRNDAEIAAVVGERIGRLVDGDDVRYLIDEKLRALGVLQADDGSQPAVAKSNPLLALRWRFVVSNPRVTRRITAPFAKLFRPYVVLPLLVAFALASGWLLLTKGLGSATHQALYEPGMLLLIFGLTIVSAGWHEFGHAAACRYGGATPGAMGVGLYLVWPAFYTEVSDCYRLGRWGRVRVDVGGLYFNAIFAVAMLGVWAATGFDAILLVIPAQLLQMLRQLLPFVRFDGYHILADLTGVPDLFSHIKPTLLGLVPGRRRQGQSQPLKRWARVVVTTWVLIVIPVLLASLVLMIKVLPRIAVTAWDSLGLQYDVLLANWVDGAWAQVGVRLLSMFTIALPLVSMTYLLARIVRRTVSRLWRVTQGRPRLRVAVVLAAAGAAALIGWMWRSDGDVEPIRADERGTLLDPFLPVAQTSPQTRMMALAQLGAPQALYAGSPAHVAQTAPGFRQLPSSGALTPVDPKTGEEAEPRVGLVLTPRAEQTAAPEGVENAAAPQPFVLLAPESALDPAELPADPADLTPHEGQQLVEEAGLEPAPAPPDATAGAGSDTGGWVFPFDEPRAAREHDNQARAVNTADGSVVYDVSFAMVWVTEGDAAVDHRNDAYALASCTGCGTVAVAFQVILVVGQADVVVPENVSVAVNYDCTACTTYALAVQLVATLTQAPSEAAMAQLEAIWAYAREVEARIESMPLSEIHAELTKIEAAILGVLLRDDGEASLDASVAEDGDGGVEVLATSTPTPMPTPTPTGSNPTPTPSPATAGTATPTASPEAMPTPTAAGSPTSARSQSPSEAAVEPSEEPTTVDEGSSAAPSPSAEPAPQPTDEPQQSPAPE